MTSTVAIVASSTGGTANQDLTLTVKQAPSFTSGAAVSATVGTPFSFTVTSSGFPTATITKSGALPAGVTFVTNSDGTATISGTPGVGKAGTYPLTLTAKNGVAPNATQAVTLTVH